MKSEEFEALFRSLDATLVKLTIRDSLNFHILEILGKVLEESQTVNKIVVYNMTEKMGDEEALNQFLELGRSKKVSYEDFSE